MTKTQLPELMRRVAQNRDRAAYGELFDELAPLVKASLMKRGLDSLTAEDILQDVMLSVWTKAGLFEPSRGSVHAWVHTIARNAMIDRIRRRRPDVSIDMVEWDPEDESENSEQQLIRRDMNRLLGKAMAEVPQDQLTVVRMAYEEELSHAEIAQRLKLPLGTVKSRMRLAYACLKRALEAQQ